MVKMYSMGQILFFKSLNIYFFLKSYAKNNKIGILFGNTK